LANRPSHNSSASPVVTKPEYPFPARNRTISRKRSNGHCLRRPPLPGWTIANRPAGTRAGNGRRAHSSKTFIGRPKSMMKPFVNSKKNRFNGRPAAGSANNVRTETFGQRADAFREKAAPAPEWNHPRTAPGSGSEDKPECSLAPESASAAQRKSSASSMTSTTPASRRRRPYAARATSVIRALGKADRRRRKEGRMTRRSPNPPHRTARRDFKPTSRPDESRAWVRGGEAGCV